MKYQEKECPVCGAWFMPQRTNVKYCPDCRRHPEQKLRKIEYHTQRNIRLYGTGRKPEKVRCTCDYCGKEFFTYGKKKDFCSADCASKYRIAHTVCAYCKKPMTETDNVYDVMGKTWYCSDECKEKASWDLARAAGTVKTCPNCGKEHIKGWNILFKGMLSGIYPETEGTYTIPSGKWAERMPGMQKGIFRKGQILFC